MKFEMMTIVKADEMIRFLEKLERKIVIRDEFKEKIINQIENGAKIFTVDKDGVGIFTKPYFLGSPNESLEKIALSSDDFIKRFPYSIPAQASSCIGINDTEYADTMTQEQIERFVQKKQKALEEVLVINKQMYDLYEDFELCVDREYEFKLRGSADPDVNIKGVETDKRYKQVIPYFIFIKDGKILTYKKSKKSSETRLHNFYSIGIGGHVHPSDGKGIAAVRHAAIRECKEEIGVSPARTAFNLGRDNYIIIDIKGNAADYHIGFCQVVVEWYPEEIQLSDEVDKITWRTLKELRGMDLEEWSEWLLDWLERDFTDLLEV